MSIWSLTYQQSVFKRYHSDKPLSESFTYKMAAKINWYRCGTKLHHCHPVYSTCASKERHSGSIGAIAFYRTMLCIRGTSHGPVSVSVRLCLCPSVTSRSSTKTAKRRITQTTPHDSPRTLVFWSQRPPRNSTWVTPCGGAECRWGGSKSATFDK